MSQSALAAALSSALPRGLKLDFFHLSTPPFLCPALYAPPPGADPVKTYCESHTLLLTHDVDLDSTRRSLSLFAIEIYIYTSETLTTVFVSKADSTGFTHLIQSQHGSQSVLRSITSAFISYLVESRHRPDRKLVVSLFARAQDQYLFPGSIEHGKKHVLDDRGLVKWWCRALDPVLRQHPHDGAHDPSATLHSRGYLVVPGHDRYETTAFFPRTTAADPADQKRWIYGHPLRELTSYPTAAPRSIIPHFPDDPKARFLLELDDEIASAPTSQNQQSPSPSKRGTGQWKSVRSLEQFWELMAYRQECSSGRLVGFVWVVFTPNKDLAEHVADAPDSPSLRPAKRKMADMGEQLQSNDEVNAKKPTKRRKLEGLILSRPPRVKTITQKRGSLPEKSKYWYWPKRTRGSVILEEKAYKRATDILLRLDFATVEVACASTEKFVKQVAVISGVKHSWGVSVEGTAKPTSSESRADLGPAGSTLLTHGLNSQHLQAKGQATNLLNCTAVRKKPKPDKPTENPEGVASLNPGLVRRKQPTKASSTQLVNHAVNTLGDSFVRKKPK